MLADARQLTGCARHRVASAVNAELTKLYWHIGRGVCTVLLQGLRAAYGKQVVAKLAQPHMTKFGKGWGGYKVNVSVE